MKVYQLMMSLVRLIMISVIMLANTMFKNKCLPFFHFYEKWKYLHTNTYYYKDNKMPIYEEKVFQRICNRCGKTRFKKCKV